MKSTKKFCYLNPKFPDKAYSVVLFLTSSELGSTILPLEFIYLDFKDIQKSINKAAKEINKGNDSFEIMETSIVLPLSFQSIYPLKEEHWSTNIPKYTIDSRFKAFVPLLERPYLFKILITPGFFDKKEERWYFNAAYPFNFLAAKDEIEEFILNSDQPVDTSANCAALYTLETPIKFNWKTGKKEEVDFDIPKQAKIIC